MIELLIPNKLRSSLNMQLLEKRAQKCFSLTGLKQQHITLKLCDDMEMRRLNKNYRGIDETTDVLSFNLDFDDPRTQETYLGDIIISIPRAALQAIDHDQSLEDEIAFLLIHGLLHLQGYDHTEEKQKNEMFALQKNIFLKLINTENE